MPAIVREKPEGGYEMIAGHNKFLAPGTPKKKKEDIIVKALEIYQRNQNRNRDRGGR